MKRLMMFCICVVAINAHAYSGDELLIDCQWYIDVAGNNNHTKNLSKSLSSGRCQGFISATINSYNYYIKNQHITENLICLSDNPDTLALAKKITGYLQANESKLGAPASDVAIEALRQSYQCE